MGKSKSIDEKLIIIGLYEKSNGNATLASRLCDRIISIPTIQAYWRKEGLPIGKHGGYRHSLPSNQVQEMLKLYKNYGDTGEVIRQGKELGYNWNHQSIGNYVKKYGFKIYRRMNEKMRKKIVELYEKCGNYKKVGELCGCSAPTVKKYVKKEIVEK